MAVDNFAEFAGVNQQALWKIRGGAYTLCLERHDRGLLKLFAEAGELLLEIGDLLA